MDCASSQYIMKRIRGDRMKKLLWLIGYTGIWVPVALIGAAYAIGNYLGFEVDPKLIISLASIGVTISLVTWSNNSSKISNGKPTEEIDFLDVFGSTPDQYTTNTGINKAKRPPVAESLMFEKPRGFCFGTFKGKYCCRTPEMQGGIMVCGGAGSGKTTTAILPFVINNKETMHSLVVDIKHEITDMTVVKDKLNPGYGDDGKTVIFDPLDRYSFGYDPFYALNSDSTDGEIYECMQLIAISLVPPQGGDKSFWSDTARSMFISCLIYFYKYKKWVL